MGDDDGTYRQGDIEPRWEEKYINFPNKLKLKILHLFIISF